ncbi:FAD-binding oxidoreductase [Paractinoplanes globisporus]|uniref:FAD-binding oxidoreductase n=1 Tax=Paractinoplanes globisporus TaxID=113565 RepID=A0ABW6WFK0_9ACTN|nr:FAD-binding oxidoreductase [Actinoplanes globisporus]
MRTRHRRPAWHVATVVETRPETPNSARLVLDVPTWPGNEAGTHVDVRLTAPDGYQTTRSYSVATSEPGKVVLGIDELPDGEVSPFLVREVRAGDTLEIRGPLGSYFVWRAGQSDRPVQLIAGGSGVVPLFAMAAAHAAASDPSQFRLLYSVRTPAHVYFRDELAALAGPSLAVDYIYTRQAPPGWAGMVGRLTKDSLASTTIAPHQRARIFVCGSTAFAETVVTWLLELGHSARDILTERFGGL